jgi:hypothetical protein
VPRTLGAAGPAPSALRIGAQVFPGRSAASSHPDLQVYVADLVRPYGGALRADLPAEGAGHAYGEMAEALIRGAVAEDEPVDLLLLAFAAPDVQPGRSAALYLSSVCPGRPLAFALCDQGTAVAYTAVRLAGDYLRSGEFRRALVVAVEQSVLHHEPIAGETGPALPQCHAGVVLRFEGAAATGAPGVCQYTSVAGTDAAGLLSRLCGELPGRPERRVLVLGEELAELCRHADIGEHGLIVRPAGRPLTGAWSALAGQHAAWAAEGRTAVLADYDHCSRTLSTYTLEPSADAEPG